MERLTSILGMAPDGRELFRYRLNEDAYARARAAVRWALSGSNLGRLNSEYAALFCVFGAEWWRREHRNGPWSWHGIKRELSIEDAAYNDITRCVRVGLGVLKRKVLTTDNSTEYLITLACEGGLPLRRLEVDGANLTVYFRTLLEHFEATGVSGDEPIDALERVARLHEARLPVSLRHEVVYRLAGELVGKAWKLRRSLGGAKGDLIATLDAESPGWKDELPLLLSDAAALALLRGLLADVARVAQGQSKRIRFVTEVVLPPQGVEEAATLRRTLAAPYTIDDAVIAKLFGKAPEGQRLLVRARNEAGESLRVGALGRAGASGWAWQPAPNAVLTGSAAQGQLVVEAASRQGAALEASSIEGSGRLGDLPWVFRQSEGRAWELVGIGSTTRREEELLVAVPKNATVEGPAERVGEVLGRSLLRVRGEIRIQTEVGPVRIRTTQTENSASAFELRGRGFRDMLVPGAVVWRGMPRVVAQHGTLEVPASLELHGEGGWRPAKASEVGRLELRALRNGEVVFRDRVLVVPDDLQVRLEVGAAGRPGRVLVSSARLQDAGVGHDPRWTSERLGGPPRVTIVVTPGESSPARLPVRLTFGGTVLDGTVPFPVRAMRFEGPAGEEIPSGTVLHVRRLGGVRAVGLSPTGQGRFHVTLSAQLDGGAPLHVERTLHVPLEATGEYVLGLRDIQDTILSILDATERLDAVVRVRLWQAGGSERDITVVARRYDWRLVPDRETGDVALADYRDEALDDIVVEARPFAAITEVQAVPRLRSPRFVEPRWVFEPEKRSGGPWLLTARQGAWYRCRPLALMGGGPRRLEPTGLSAILEIPSEEARLAGLRTHLAAMAGEWSHPDWPLVDAFARLLGTLPASTFDLFRVLPSVPKAVAMLAVRAAGWTPTELVAVVDGLDELVFRWEAVPLHAWAAAYEALFNATSEVAPDSAVTEVQARAKALAAWVSTAEIVFHHWWRRGHPAAPLDPSEEVRLSMRPECSTDLLRWREDARDDLIRRHGGDDGFWPPPPLTFPKILMPLQLDDPGQVTHRRGVLDAPVICALAAAGRKPIDRAVVTFLDSARAFDEDYFDQCFKFTFCALLANGQGVWK